MDTTPIIRRKLADEVRDRLLTMIRGGELQPGDQLPSERTLMEQFGVGRPAVREALQSLGTAGLIEINHGERARIAIPNAEGIFSRIGQTMLHLLQTSPQTLEDLKQARVLFEVGMTKLAASQASAEDIQTLESLLQKQEEAMSDSAAFVTYDMAFHAAIAAISRNSVCKMLSEAMLDWLFHFRRELLRIPGSEIITMAEHRRIVAAIAAHDIDAAEKSITDHLTRSDQRYRILEDAMDVRSQKGQTRTPAALGK